ncbi:SDR family oxidoreductase [Neobacillus sp. OS1-33]|uniref:SDR family oxidoreductase n=2 Tax=Neobacillus TaxID=2675232 RepID=UPI0027DF62E4|nr:SDR family oxidoreductase [Neobacillus sp. OS1-33]WML25938.1 SDR family oxidoreductase [Neobacillus sp. OS1-33]
MRKKTALITGGASGIGKKTAFYLAENGYQLAINYRKSKSEAISLANQLTTRYGTKNIACQGDVSNKEECIRLVNEVLSSFPTVDVLVHNAGPYIHERKKLTDYSFDDWNYIIQGNLSAVFYLSKLIIPSMRIQKWGRIITIGYDRVETAPGWIYRSAFAAAKTGAASLTRTIAIEEAEHGITANMVCPGDIISEWKERDIEDARGNGSIGRQGTGEDIARVIAFLTDEKSDLITGSIIPVTGGLDVLGKVLKN